jgi:hypothetical protein
MKDLRALPTNIDLFGSTLTVHTGLSAEVAAAIWQVAVKVRPLSAKKLLRSAR